MAKNNNITMISNSGYGGNFSRTSYDVRQEINAKVIGILNKNNNIRKELLERNIGLYPLSSSEEGIGYISNFYSNLSRKPLSFDEKGLLGFTHLNESEFQKQIRTKYDIDESSEYYSENSLPNDSHLKWHGKYDNYTDYINQVYGLSLNSLNFLSNAFADDKLKNGLGINPTESNLLTIRSILIDFLQYDNIKYAMEKTRIGTITPKPLLAIGGINTTNINNFSGTDTPLGIISNYAYAHTLKNGAQFNSLRKTQYITPDAYKTLGNKLSTISTIASDYRFDEETGRLAYDIGGESKVRDLENYEGISDLDFIDLSRDIFNSDNGRTRNIDRNKYQPFKNFEYIVESGRPLLTTFNNPLPGNKVYGVWNEGDISNTEVNATTIYGDTMYASIDNQEYNGLLQKTQELFAVHNEKGNDTLIGRFHTSGGRDKTHNETNLFQTAVSKFGLSHGRNLLNKDSYESGIATKDKKSGYSNPYCRTWTYHHQYNSLDKLIRSNIDFEELQSNWWQYGRVKDSATRLKDNSVLNKNGFVNITPVSNTTNAQDSVKKCMFSIENLAWKDVNKNKSDYNGLVLPLSDEQTGPNGGRIMWFPPYNLRFGEQVTTNWQSNTFIGRGENIYTYTNTERRGNLSFDLLVDHPSILDMWKKNKFKEGEEVDAEQKILRFFAGCDELKLDDKVIDTGEYEDDYSQPIWSEIEPEEKDVTEEVVFYIFFPNNYSGRDDKDDKFYYLAYQYEGGKPEYNKKQYKNLQWEYRVDDDYKYQKMSKGNYTYFQTFELNKNIEFVNKDENFNATISFLDIYNDKLKDKVVNKATIITYATSHGYDESNYDLCYYRYKYAKEFLTQHLKVKFENIEKFQTKNIIDVSDEDKKNVHGISARRGRCAKIVLETIIKKSTNSAENATNKTSNEEEINSESVQSKEVIKTTTKIKKRNKRKDAKKVEEVKEELKQTVSTIATEPMSRWEYVQSLMKKNREKETQPVLREITGYKKKKTYKMDESAKQRWENEAQYFEMLEANNSFLYSKIIEKVKYFNPAFHSITPEGFNSRLGFLHQCTRQGNTLGVSDDNTTHKSAGNLAFGRPPICILRIGDFFHTKIMIDSINIDYEEPKWDMNPEGIGMQPMYAKITISFIFLGGSDLTAPISRLQNALSFNYYANQSIYDDRADIAIYENNKPKIQGEPWKPKM